MTESPKPTPGPTTTQAPKPSIDEVMTQFKQLSSGSRATTSDRPDIAFGGLQYGPMGGGRGQARLAEGDRLGPRPITKSVQDMINEYYNWTDEQQNQLRAKLALIDKSALRATDKQIVSLWADYVQQSADAYAAGKSLTPWDILAKDITTRGGVGSLAGTKTQKTSDTSLTSRVDAEALFEAAAQQLLGRSPTSQESAAFHGMLNASERANPTTSITTTTTNDEGEVVSQSRTSSGGVSAAAAQKLARDRAKENPEYGAYQAATTYHNAMMQMIMRGY